MNATTVHVTVDEAAVEVADGATRARRREPPRHPAAPALQGSRPPAARRLPHLPRPRRGHARRAGRLPPARARRHGRLAPSTPRRVRVRAAVLDLTLLDADARRRAATASARSARRPRGTALAAPTWPRRCTASRSTRPSRSSSSTARRASSAAAARWPATTSSRSAPSRCSAAATTRGSASSATAPWPPRSAPRAASAWPPARPARCAPRRRRRPIVARGRDHVPLLRRGLRHRRCAVTRATGGWRSWPTTCPPTARAAGMLCVKGRFGTGFVHSRDRITTPLVKRDGRWARSSWDEALDAAADGPGAQPRPLRRARLAPRPPTRTATSIQKFCRVVMGTNNVDHCTRLCHSPSVEAMLVSMGSGATSNSYQDYEEAGCLMVVGADASANHPVIAMRFRRAVSARARGSIVVNPKRVELCDQADLWIQPAPGHRRGALQRDGARDPRRGAGRRGLHPRRAPRASTPGRARSERYTLEHAEARHRRAGARTSPRPPAGTRGPTVRAAPASIWGMGITQHINGTAQRPRAAEPVAGRRADGLARLRHLAAARPEQRAGLRRRRLHPDQPARLPALRAGDARRASSAPGACGRPAAAGPGRDRDGRGLPRRARSGRCTWWARTRCSPSPTCTTPRRRSTSSTSWSCRTSSCTRRPSAPTCSCRPPPSPRRTGPSPTPSGACSACARPSPPPGEARPDWWITCRAGPARRAAARRRRRQPVRLPRRRRDLRRDGAALTPFLARACRTRGSTARAGCSGRAPRPTTPARRYLYGETFPRGRARFVPAPQTAEAAELPDADYPFLLNTGPAALPLARRHPDPPRGGPARAGAAARGRGPPARRAAAGRGHGRPAARGVPARRADRLRAR